MAEPAGIGTGSRGRSGGPPTASGPGTPVASGSGSPVYAAGWGSAIPTGRSEDTPMRAWDSLTEDSSSGPSPISSTADSLVPAGSSSAAPAPRTPAADAPVDRYGSLKRYGKRTETDTQQQQSITKISGRSRKEDFKVIKEIGFGSRAVVKEAIHLPTSLSCALKCIKKPLPLTPALSTQLQATQAEFQREVDVLKSHPHENICGFLDAFETRGKYVVAMELCRGGTVLERVEKLGRYPEGEAAYCIATVLNAVKFLHSLGIAHRDLKPQNLLYVLPVGNPLPRDSWAAAASLLKLCDFGVAGILSRGMSTLIGTPFYLAPEILGVAGSEKKTASGSGYSVAVDMWSLGCTTYCMLVGSNPFQDCTDFDVLFRRIREATYSPIPPSLGLSTAAESFIQALLSPKPLDRMSAQEALDHPWIRQNVAPEYLAVLEEVDRKARVGRIRTSPQVDPNEDPQTLTNSLRRRLKAAAKAVQFANSLIKRPSPGGPAPSPLVPLSVQHPALENWIAQQQAFVASPTTADSPVVPAVPPRPSPAVIQQLFVAQGQPVLVQQQQLPQQQQQQQQQLPLVQRHLPYSPPLVPVVPAISPRISATAPRTAASTNDLGTDIVHSPVHGNHRKHAVQPHPYHMYGRAKTPPWSSSSRRRSASVDSGVGGSSSYHQHERQLSNSPPQPAEIPVFPILDPPRLQPLPMPLASSTPHLTPMPPLHTSESQVSQSWGGSTPNIWHSLESLARSRRSSLSASSEELQQFAAQQQHQQQQQQYQVQPVYGSPGLSPYQAPMRRPGVESSRSDPAILSGYQLKTSPGLGPLPRSSSVPIRHGSNEPYVVPGSPSRSQQLARAGHLPASPLAGPQRGYQGQSPSASTAVLQPYSPQAQHPVRSRPEPFFDAHLRAADQDPFGQNFGNWNPSEPFDNADTQTLAFPSGSSSSWSTGGDRMLSPNLAHMDPNLLPSLGIQNPPGVGTAYEQGSPSASPSFYRPAPMPLQPVTGSPLQQATVRRAYSVGVEMQSEAIARPTMPRAVYPAASAPNSGSLVRPTGTVPGRNFTTESILSGSSSGTIVVAGSGEIPATGGSHASGDFSYLLSKMAAVGVGSEKAPPRRV